MKDEWVHAYPVESQRPQIRRIEVVPPVEAAYRVWEEARSLSADEPERARRLLNQAEDLFDRLGRFNEVAGVRRDRDLLAGGS